MASQDVVFNIGAIDNASAVLKRVASNISDFAKKTGESMKAIGASVTKIGAGVAAVGASVTGPLAVAVSKFANIGDELDKMAKRTGFSVEALSELAFAAEQSGASLDVVEKAIKGMQRQITGSELGSEGFADALALIGMEIESIQGLSPEDQFTMIADALAKIDDPTKKAGLAMKLFGKSGADLIPMISETAKGIGDLRQEARDLGRQMSTQDATVAAEYTDAWNRVKSAVSGVVNQIGAALAPSLTRVANILSALIVRVSTWVSENRTLIQVLAAVGVGLTTLGTILVTAGGMIAALGFAFTGLATAATAAGTVIAAVFSPLGAIIAAVVAPVVILGTMFLVASYRTGLLGEQVAAVGRLLRIMGGIARQTFGGIFDALKEGNLEKAIAIGMAGAKVAFYAGIESMYDSFIKIWPLMLDAAKEFFLMFGKMAIRATGVIAKALANPLTASAQLASSFATGGMFKDISMSASPSDFLASRKRQAQLELDKLTAGTGSAESPADRNSEKQVDLSSDMLEQLKKIAEGITRPPGDSLAMVQVGQ